MRALLLVMVITLTGGGVGCGGEDCDCGPPAKNLTVLLDDVVPADHTIEVCFESHCTDAEGFDVDRTAATVSYELLGDWKGDRSREVTVGLRDLSTWQTVDTWKATPEKRESCCGDYWVATT